MSIHGVTFNLGSTKVFSTAIFETCIPFTKIHGLLQVCSVCTFT